MIDEDSKIVLIVTSEITYRVIAIASSKKN